MTETMKKIFVSSWPPSRAEFKRALEQHMAVMDDDEFDELCIKVARPMLNDREFEA